MMMAALAGGTGTAWAKRRRRRRRRDAAPGRAGTTQVLLNRRPSLELEWHAERRLRGQCGPLRQILDTSVIGILNMVRDDSDEACTFKSIE